MCESVQRFFLFINNSMRWWWRQWTQTPSASSHLSSTGIIRHMSRCRTSNMRPDYMDNFHLIERAKCGQLIILITRLGSARCRSLFVSYRHHQPLHRVNDTEHCAPLSMHDCDEAVTEQWQQNSMWKLCWVCMEVTLPNSLTRCLCSTQTCTNFQW